MNARRFFLLPLSLASFFTFARTTAANPPPPPGTVIRHSPASSGDYIGSPSLCIAPDGSYLASHDFFGPRSKEYQLASGHLYRSTDKGKSWQHLHHFTGFFWTSLFTHRNQVYLIGTDKHHGNLILRRSPDSGKSWSPPATIAPGQWHSAPMPVVEHQGRLWRAFEDAHTGEKWGERYRARMLSAPADADLLNPASWTISTPLARQASWNQNDFAAWLEGNAVVDPHGHLVNILRVDTTHFPEKAAIVRISKNGSTASFDPLKDLIDLPGGSKKFTIRKDPRDNSYWTIATIVPERHHPDGRPASIRNTLALLHSQDLRHWDIRTILLYHPDVVRHGFQYVDWTFEGDDIIAACRTAWDDAEGGARNNHDANFLTFHRWPRFRQLSRKDDAPMPEPAAATHETSLLSIRGSTFEISRLTPDSKAFSNRDYRWLQLPDSLAGLSYTRLDGGTKPFLRVTAKKDSILRIATSPHSINLHGWQDDGLRFSYSDRENTTLHVFSRKLAKGESIPLPRGNWTGAILLFEDR